MSLALEQLQLAAPATQHLIAMLRTCRPHGSPSEHAFIAHFLLPLGVDADGFGNLWLQIGAAPVLWSSHVDTCHRKGGTQQLAIDAAGVVRLALGSPSNCLGADCTAGVWLMTEMIHAGVPGVYVFHRGEERGGLGSRYVAAAESDRLAGLRAAVAFDRRGTSSVITHQSHQRCCSDIFAVSLAASIGLGHAPDPTGAFTDTANYTEHIGECTNLSVGYNHEHTTHETLNLGYLLRLRDAVLDADFSQLVFDREPGALDPDFEASLASSHGAGGWGRASSRLYDIVRDYPSAVADFLDCNGVTADDVEAHIHSDIPF